MNAALPVSRPGSQPKRTRSLFLQRGNVSIDLNIFEVRVDREPVTLTFHELKLLLLFCEYPDKILPYQFWTTGVWGKFGGRSLRHLNVLVHRLRAKLEGSEPYSIRTVRSRGYGFLKSTDESDADE